MRPRRLFLFLVILLNSLLSAQVRVVKDYNLCLYGVQDTSGKWIVPPKYTEIFSFNRNGCAVVRSGDKEGVIDNTGRIVLPDTFSSIIPCWRNTHAWFDRSGDLEKRFFIYEYKGRKGIVDSTGKIILPAENQEIYGFSDTACAVRVNDHAWIFCGYHGSCGKLPDDLEYPGVLSPGIYKVRNKTSRYDDSRYGACNAKGTIVIPVVYNKIDFNRYEFPVIEAMKNGRVSYYNPRGELLFEDLLPFPKYYLSSYSETYSMLAHHGVNAAAKNGKWGLIKYDGTLLIPFEYDTAWIEFSKRGWPTEETFFFVFRKNNRDGIADGNGNWIVPPTQEQVHYLGLPEDPLHEQDTCYLFSVRQNGKWGMVTQRNATVLPCEWDTCFAMNDHQWLFWSAENPVLVWWGISYGQLAWPLTPKQYRRAMKHANVENDEEGNAYVQSVQVRSGEDPLWLEPLNTKLSPDAPYAPFVLGQNFHSGYRLYVDRIGMENKSVSWHPLYRTFFFDNSRNAQAVAVYTDKNKRAHLLVRTTPDSIHPAWYVERGGDNLLVNENAIVAENIHADTPPEMISTDPVLFSFRENNLYGLMDANGKIILSPTYSAIQNIDGQHVWVSEKRYATVEGRNCRHHWNIYNTTTQKLQLDSVHLASEAVRPETNVFPLATVHGVGLYNVTAEKFVCPPVYAGMYRMNYPTTRFIVESCKGFVGAIDSSGKMIVEPTWRKAVLVRNVPWQETANDDNSSRGSRPLGTYTHPPLYVFSGDSTAVIVLDDGSVIPYTAVTKLIPLSIEMERGREGKNWYTSGDDSNFNTRLICDSFHADSIQQQFLADYMFLHYGTSILYSEYYHPPECACLGPYVYHYGDDIAVMSDAVYSRTGDGYIRLVFQTDSVLSWRESLMDGRSHYPFRNYLWKNGQPQLLALDSLFADSAWRVIVANHTMNYLAAHPGIETDCSNPSQWSRILRYYFVLSPEGLLLTPPWDHYAYTGRYEILIPWTELKEHIRPDVAEKILK